MKYFLIAGEASGDLHASRLIHELRALDSGCEMVGFGGKHIEREGCRLLQTYENMAFMGVAAVIKNWRRVLENFRIAKSALLDEQPDVLILIDYPSFNLKIAEYCKKTLPRTRIVYYIPPKIWAWKTWRVHRIARLCDLILGIFPFEPSFYTRYGYRCEYVGNPTMEEMLEYELCHEREEERPVVVLLPGSRRSEISHCLPTMLAAAKAVNSSLGQRYTIAVGAAPGIEESFYAPYLDGGCVLTRDTLRTIRSARAAVVNSGTATLETALMGCPQTAVYHIACSRWLGWLKPLLFKIPYFTLVNIIPAREVIQELIADRFTQRGIEEELRRLLTDDAYRSRMRRDYEEIRHILTAQCAAREAAKRIVEGGR